MSDLCNIERCHNIRDSDIPNQPILSSFPHTDYQQIWCIAMNTQILGYPSNSGIHVNAPNVIKIFKILGYSQILGTDVVGYYD